MRTRLSIPSSALACASVLAVVACNAPPPPPDVRIDPDAPTTVDDPLKGETPGKKGGV